MEERTAIMEYLCNDEVRGAPRILLESSVECSSQQRRKKMGTQELSFWNILGFCGTFFTKIYTAFSKVLVESTFEPVGQGDPRT